MMSVAQLHRWLGNRNSDYIVRRATALSARYGLSSSRAERRVQVCVQQLAEGGILPTFPTPGRVVRRNPKFFQELQAAGAEFAVHGYDHVDFNTLSSRETRQQFLAAAESFQKAGIHFTGFRCPYLSYSDELLPAVPDGMFEYSSNKAIWWDVAPAQEDGSNAVFDKLTHFYRPHSANTTFALPSVINGLVEIPVSVPDDLQLCDGLGLRADEIARTWCEILAQSHRRGELFVLMFHPESFDDCRFALQELLRQSRLLQPPVWLTQLREISR